MTNPIEKIRSMTAKQWAVPLVFIFYVVMRAVDRVFSTRIAKIMQSPAYSTIYSNIIFTVGLFFGQFLISIGYVAYRRFIQKDTRYGLGWFSPVSKLACTGTGSFPQWLLFLFIVGDQLNAILGNWGAIGEDQNTINLISQMVIPVMLILAFIFLKTRFHQTHYISCLLVVFAVLVLIIPSEQCIQEYYTASSHPNITDISLKNPFYTCFLPPLTESSKQTSHTLSIVFLVLAVIPAGGSNVFKQWCLQGRENKYGRLDVFYASMWSTLWQTVLGLALIPMIWINLPGQTLIITPSETGQLLKDTFTCFFGNAPPHRLDEATASSADWQAEQEQIDLCTLESGSAFKWFVIYSIFNLSFNITMLWLTKQLSTVWVQVATGAVLFLSDILSTSSALMGESASPMSYGSWISLLIGLIAIWLYNVNAEVDVEGKPIYTTGFEEEKVVADVDDEDIEAKMQGSVADMSMGSHKLNNRI